MKHQFMFYFESAKRKLCKLMDLKMMLSCFLLFFSVFGLLESSVESKESVSLTGLLDKEYNVVLLNEGNILEVAITGEGLDEADTVQIAQNIQQQKKKHTIVYTYEQMNTNLKKNSLENLRYKAEATDQEVNLSSYKKYSSVEPSVNDLQNWDLSENTLDLVDGSLTINLCSEKELSEETLLSQAKGLAILILKHNQQAGIQSVELTIKSGNKHYQWSSKCEDSLVFLQSYL